MTSLSGDVILPVTEKQKGYFQKNIPQLPVSFSWKVRCEQVNHLQELERALRAMFQEQEALFIRFIYQPDVVYPLQKIDTSDRQQLYIVLDDQPGNEDAFRDNCRRCQEELSEYVVFVASRGKACYDAYIQIPFGLVDFHSVVKLCSAIQQVFSGKQVEVLLISYSQYASWQAETLKQAPDEVSAWFKQQQATETAPFIFERATANRPAYESTIATKKGRSLLLAAEKAGMSVRDCCYGIFSVLLGHFTGRDVVTPGVLLNGRVYDELGNTAGLIDQVIPLPVALEDSFKALVDRLSQSMEERQSLAEYFTHEFIEEVAGNELRYVVQYVRIPEHIADYSDWRVVLPGAALQLDILEGTDGLTTRWYYDTTRFDRNGVEQIDQVLQRLLDLAATGLENLTDVHLLADELSFDAPLPVISQPGFIALFQTACKKYPDAIAVVDGDTKYTYQSLQLATDKLAAVLIGKKGVRPGDIVAVSAGRSARVIIAVIAIIKAGAAFLPIDRSQPASRIQSILEDAAPVLILTDDNEDGPGCPIGSLLDEVESQVNYPEENSEALSYVIYTSGTTGKPKGCMLTGGNLSHYLHWCIKTYTKDTACGNFPWFTPLSFDLTITSIFLPLVTGKKVVVFGEAEQTDVILRQCFSGKEGIDCIKLTPSHISLLKHQELTHSPVQVVITGGEQLLASQATVLLGLNRDILLYNEYGPTEATVGCIVKRIRPADELITIGRPIDGMEAFILNNAGRVVMPGLAGELFLAGNGIAKGYLNNEALTSEKFIVAGTGINRRLYRTGDLVRQLPDGELVFLGRTDQQLKIRGYRIETDEIIHQVNNIAGIKTAHVLAEQHGDDLELVLFFNGDADVKSIRASLEEHLPVYMVPQYYYRLKEIPLTVNGKVDTQRLLSHSLTIKDDTKIYEAPVNETEEIIAAIWKELLQVEQVGRQDHFFASGGQSIKASALVARLNKHFEAAFTLKDIFDCPLLFQQAIRAVRGVKIRLTEPVALPLQESYELSGQQLRIWTEHHGVRFSTAYNMPVAYKVEGDFSRQRFAAAFEKLIGRFESLRTTFICNEDGIPRQVIHNDHTFIYEYEESAVDANAVCRQHAELHIPLDTLPLYRVALYKLDEQEWLLLINLHHIIADGLSEEILFEQLLMEYHQQSAGSAPGLQYKEYAAWQNRQLQHTGSRDYWLEKFKSTLPATALTVSVNGVRQQNNIAGSYTVTLGRELSEKILSFSTERKTTVFPLLLSIVDVLLYRYGGNKDRVLAIPVDTRLHEAFMRQVGFFLNTLLLRNELDTTASFHTLTDRWNHQLAEGLQHQQYPYEALAKELTTLHGISGDSLFQVLVNFQERQQGNIIETGSIKLEKLQYEYNTGAKAELAFNFSLHKKELELTVDYNKSSYPESFIRQLVRHCLFLAGQLMRTPETPVGIIPMLSVEEITEWMNCGKGPVTDIIPEETVIARFREVATLYADSTAIVHEGKAVSYGTLLHQVSTMRMHGIIPGQIVPVLASRNELTITAMLAVMNSGGVYLPVDANWPVERVMSVIRECGARLVLNTSGQPYKLESIEVEIPAFGVAEASAAMTGSSAAYMIFTSGSTGKPKGLSISHTGLLNTITAQIAGFGVEKNDHCLWFSSPAFDASLSEVLLALLSGATIYTASPELIGNQYIFLNWMMKNGITVATIPPAYLSALSTALPDTLRVLIAAGEALPERTGLALAGKHMLFNAYGPSENAICTTFTRIYPTDNLMPIGMPMANVKVKVLDADHQPVPAGVTGELHVSGPGLTNGYYNNEAETGLRFYTQGEEIWYRTGDFVRWLDDGRLAFAGRKDEQVKINGNRVELEEIRHCLTAHQLVKDAVVVYKTFDGRNQPALVAYVVPEDGPCNTDILMSYARTALPAYMVPSFFVIIPDIPLTSNGKKDITGLPSPFSDEEVQISQPLSESEEIVSRLYTGLLGMQADRNTHFFAAGGNSLRAIQVISTIYRLTQKGVTLGELYRYPQVKELSALLDQKEREPVAKVEQIENDWHPATPMQQRIWADMEISGGSKYLMKGSFELNGLLDETRFRNALNRVLEVQEMLRCRFRVLGDGLQYKVFAVAENQVQYGDGSAISMDPEKDPLCRFFIQKQEEQRHLFTFVLHHLIADAWSIKVLITSILEYYGKPGLYKTIAPYREYARNMSQLVPVKVDRPAMVQHCLLKDRDAAKNTDQGPGYFRQVFHKYSNDTITELSAVYKVSPFALITGLQALAFMDDVSQPVLTVFAPLHGRFDPAWNNTVGLFMNVVPVTIYKQLYTHISDLIEHVQTQCTAFLDQPERYIAHWVPTEKEETAGRGVLEIHIDDFAEHYRQELITPADITVRPQHTAMSRKFSMEIHFTSDSQGLSAECLYDQGSYSGNFVQRGIAKFEQILAALNNEPSQTVMALEYKLHNTEKDMMQAAQMASIRSFLKKN
ncbi:non-ribosomal peptide synthetase [Chitinophaga sp. S165]|uniref:non-ribosomal peptide synthetase n=1 Tax=Chitinophaga sp. S165 TaxID=2135462 RepID=UPI000D70DA79|nr:non-ribosomal peptide synthetase [Chitinophaga sp. S165]PWV56296.1 amino acid adenylation domain-containing protein [Chitinophaga sp. S165]